MLVSSFSGNFKEPARGSAATFMDSVCPVIDANDCTRGEKGQRKAADLLGGGKEHRKARAVQGVGSASQADRATMLCDNALTNPKS